MVDFSANLALQFSLAAFPGMRHVDAVREAVSGQYADKIMGAVHAKHLQLVPQNRGEVDDALCDELLNMFPATTFRLHANVQIGPRKVVADLSSFNDHRKWFRQAGKLSKRLGAPAYSAHAGYRKNASLAQVLENARTASEYFDAPVAVEGMYPDANARYLLATWQEYRTLLDSGVPYALDLSHLNILKCAFGTCDAGFVRELLACERCIEVHLSDNDGDADTHAVSTEKTWWHSLLGSTAKSAVVFTEGNFLRARAQPDARNGFHFREVPMSNGGRTSPVTAG